MVTTVSTNACGYFNRFDYNRCFHKRPHIHGRCGSISPTVKRKTMTHTIRRAIALLPFLLLLASCSTLFATGNEKTKDAHHRNQVAGQTAYRLVWHDEFDYNGLPDSTRWSFDTHGNESGWGNNELQHYTASRLKNASVSDGLLHITAHLEDYGNKRYTSARLFTKGHGQWLYGRMECRAKLPAGRGTWPAFWMMPAEDAYGTWPASGEIDIMENVASIRPTSWPQPTPNGSTTSLEIQ